MKKKQSGWILRWFIIIFGIILLLSYFGFNIENFMNSDTTVNNLSYFSKFIFNFWDDYLRPVYDSIGKIFSPFADAILNILIKMGNGGNITIK